LKEKKIECGERYQLTAVGASPKYASRTYGVIRLEEFTLSTLAEITRMPKRSLQLWADAGVIKANPSTMREGSGVHRKFKREEAIVACIVAPFAKQKMAIGALEQVGDAVRRYLRLPRQIDGVRRAAANDDGKNYYLVVNWIADKSGGGLSPHSFNLVSDTPKRNFSDVVGNTVHVWRGDKGVDIMPIKVDIVPLNEVLRSLPQES
jgi:hypothetical protein